MDHRARHCLLPPICNMPVDLAKLYLLLQLLLYLPQIKRIYPVSPPCRLRLSKLLLQHNFLILLWRPRFDYRRIQVLHVRHSSRGLATYGLHRRVPLRFTTSHIHLLRWHIHLLCSRILLLRSRLRCAPSSPSRFVLLSLLMFGPFFLKIVMLFLKSLLLLLDVATILCLLSENPHICAPRCRRP
ncbi:hypothetical protein BD626DRAFT_499231 [Schizophyllum amplum]|uniref:Uncharacterized protein n=1 Tax=Schizophyllum amplum TaxID=97359 RepID=A0A550CCB3_9AGAR|nr:hypothetical protein BD626DRAFT_499231 [Auriculariopsis ampla]